MMEKIPQQLLKQFDGQLIKNKILTENHHLFRKWLRYYIDFCCKYGHDSKSTESLPHFINKLRGKKQSKQQQKQAYDAIIIYYEMFGFHPNWLEKSSPENRVEKEILSVCEKTVSYNEEDVVFDNNWKPVYARLSDEIKVRHYSPKTFKAYSIWVSKF